ncbi:hypothetical protein [Rhizobium sp. C4]|nr:hypothetical protein [Rhizobium sp. C4]
MQEAEALLLKRFGTITVADIADDFDLRLASHLAGLDVVRSCTQ